MNNIDFYNLTKDTYDELCKLKGVNGNKYLKLTDYNKDSVLIKKCGMNPKNDNDFIFAQLVYHALNAGQGVSLNLKFSENYLGIKEFFEGFNVPKYCNKLNNNIETLKDELTKCIQKHNKSYKSCKSVKSFLIGINNLAQNLNGKTNYRNFLKSELGTVNPAKELVDLAGKHAFKIPLACDFLKEFDEDYNNIGKPDRLVKRTLDKLCSCELKEDLKYVAKLQEIVDEVRDKKVNPDLTVYALDRMIYLINKCVDSDGFWLDERPSFVEVYLSKIK